ncbi:superoxide dismutase copper chaperone [Niveomyces insectorum RCEF 264]|uniref:Superoxide dismutase 1 copper chaperone n=1 Tax=Niveomyces insectorum RCEF 264 TaxID=1081102 RepID=A0A167U0C0_9HYPO|nr:superoxide dismutase copper chaperone [Niveomyces insectorum RCEF 264]
MKNVRKTLAGAISVFALTAAGSVYIFQISAVHPRAASHTAAATTANSTMTVDHSFQTLFAVPLSCDGCVKDVTDALHKVAGISKVEASLKDQSVSVEGTAPPSAILKAIQATGRDGILRGSGTSNSAAVSILETYHDPTGEGATNVDTSADRGDQPGHKDRFVRGLARMVQVSPSVTAIDLTVLGLAPGVYHASIRESGDLKNGVLSTGPVWMGEPNGNGSGKATEAGQSRAQSLVPRRGVVGTVEIGLDGRGAVFLDRPFQVWEVIGHAFVVTPVDDTKPGATLENDKNTAVGVIARSAGVWDNDKTVCSCTGKTLWDERRDEVKNGML